MKNQRALVLLVAICIVNRVTAGHYDEEGNYHRSGLLARHGYYNGYYDSNGDYHHYRHTSKNKRYRAYDVNNCRQ